MMSSMYSRIFMIFEMKGLIQIKGKNVLMITKHLNSVIVMQKEIDALPDEVYE